MNALEARDRALQVVALVPVALLVAALTCPATDIEPPWDDPFGDEDAEDAGPADAPHDDARDAVVSDHSIELPADSIDPEDDAPPPPPVVVPIGCNDGEVEIAGCCAATGTHSAAIRWDTDRAVTASVECLAESAVSVERTEEAETTSHRVIVSPLPGGSGVRCSITASGWTDDLAVLEFETAPDAPWIVVTEVLPNPRGPEPVQEFVEIANLGDEPVSLSGWRLEDEGDGGSALPEDALLEPGGIALLVPEEFDTGGAGDPPADPGATILRVGRALGTQGLRNTGENVYLVDPDGEVASRYPNALGPLGDGVSAVRSPPEAPESDPFAWAVCPDEPTPGRL